MTDLAFTLTDDHITLLRAAYIRWEDCEYGAPAIDCKRPYGNSDVELDIAEALGWELPVDNEGDEYIDADMAQRAERLHKETRTALQVILRAGTFTPGRYVRSTPWSDDWVLETAP